MAILYGKIRIHANANTPVTITSASGNTIMVTIPSGKTFIDVALPGLDEYTIANGSNVKTALLSYGDFVEVQV